MNFQVIDLESGQPILMNGVVRLFEQGKDAATVAEELTKALGKKHQPRRITNDLWRERERKRFEDGTYLTLPDSWLRLIQQYGGNCADHYAHVSLKDQSKVAFTESAEKGQADVQTMMKPGRYLTTFYSHVVDKVYALPTYCNHFSQKFEENRLLIDNDADSFENVYQTGPHSCMQYPNTHSRTHCGVHPVRVYAAGDLAIAYMRRGGSITARSVVWPDKKTYSRIYGDVQRLRVMLEKEGYKPQAPYGAKLTRILHPSLQDEENIPPENLVFICPYIDMGHEPGAGSICVKDEGKHLLICKEEARAYHTNNTRGSTNGYVHPVVCFRCGCDTASARNGSNEVYVNTAGTTMIFCRACIEQHTWSSPMEMHRIDDRIQPVVMADGERIPPWRADYETFISARSGGRFHTNHRVFVRSRENRREAWAKSELAAVLAKPDCPIRRCPRTREFWYKAAMFFHPEHGRISPNSRSIYDPGVLNADGELFTHAIR